MNTEKYLQKLEAEVKRLRIREMLEESPTVRNALKHRRHARAHLLERLKGLTGRASEQNNIEYR